MNDVMSLLPLVPEAVILLAAILALLVGVLLPRMGSALASVITSTGVIAALYLLVGAPVMQPSYVMSGMLKISMFTQLAKVIILISVGFVLAVSWSWLQCKRSDGFEFPVLITLSTLGLMLLVSAGDFMALYMALELSSLALYVLASFARDSLRGAEAGLKYFVLGALASGLFLFGASLVYGFSGTTSFEGISALLTRNFAASGESAGTYLPSTGLLLGLIFVMVGLFFKVSAVPFHMWAPDVYEGAPTPVTALFSTAPKVAALAIVTRLLLEPFGGMLAQWQQIVVFVAVASMLVGAFGALRQTNIKRLLAYSSIGHVGYVLVGLAVGTPDGVQGMVVYLALYIFATIGSFSCLLILHKEGEPLEQLTDLSGMGRTHPYIAAALAIFMFSMAGIPPLAGFFGKMLVFLAAVHTGYLWLAVLGLVTSVVACYYYLKVVKIMYFDEATITLQRAPQVELSLAILVCAGVTLLFFVGPTPLMTLARMAAISTLL